MSMFRELMMAQNKKPYRDLTYLEGSGSQYIDTGITPNHDSGVEIVFCEPISDTTIQRGIFGSQFNASSRRFAIPYAGSNMGCRYNSTAELLAPLATTSSVAIRKNLIYVNGVLKRTAIYGEFTCPSTALLFSWHLNTAVGGSCAICKISSCKMWDGDTVVREFVPALWHAGRSYIDGNTGQSVTASTDKPGMYDNVSKRFFVNRGTGADFLYA